ncbi:MAG: hypothetical protein IJF78_05675 [Clostridia bacterium]|nr:hypothetical protein [Clostridia bacterium]
MEHKRIVPVLMCIVALACVILASVLVSVSMGLNRFPESSVTDIAAYLAEDGIYVDPGLISARRERGTVYVCDSPDYNRTVAELLDGNTVSAAYVIPDGEVMIMNGGARLEFGSSFTFRYFKNGIASASPAIFELSGMAAQISESKKEDIREAAVRFLERGSREFDELNVEIALDAVWENEGRYYALCSRSIDGIEITGNLVLCTVEGDTVTEAYGTWCFLTPAETYSAQLSDLLNILFNVKKDLRDRADDPENPDGVPVTITAIELCYSLYFYGAEESFCLIPCWQIVTDTAGKLIYNAIDSTLYTVK